MAVVFPTTPAPNQVVTDPATNATWMWDAVGLRWIPAATGGPIVATATVSGIAPATPSDGQLWFDTGTQTLKVWNSGSTAWQP